MTYDLKTIICASLSALFISACDQSSGDSTGAVSRETVRLSDKEFSIPIGSDGYVESGKNSVNWGFDPKFWGSTVGTVGVKGAALSPLYPIVGFSSVADQTELKVMSKIGLEQRSFDKLDFFVSIDPISKYPPAYLFQAKLPGYVECPTATFQGSKPDLESCYIHIVESGIHHSFALRADQVPLAFEVSKVFLAVISEK